MAERPVESAVADILASSMAIQAIVSDRVYQLQFPQGPTLPAVRVQLVDDIPGYDLRGPSGLSIARIQVDAAAGPVSGGDSYQAAADLAAEIDAVLSGAAGSAGGSPGVSISGMFREARRVQFDPDELRTVVVSQDYQVWWKSTT